MRQGSYFPAWLLETRRRTDQRRLGVRVWVREEGIARFVPLPALTDDDVAQILRGVESRVRALLKPRLDAFREDARPPDTLAASQALHAGVHLHAHDRQGLAHLCGYGARPPLTQVPRTSPLFERRTGQIPPAASDQAADAARSSPSSTRSR